MIWIVPKDAVYQTEQVWMVNISIWMFYRHHKCSMSKMEFIFFCSICFSLLELSFLVIGISILLWLKADIWGLIFVPFIYIYQVGTYILLILSCFYRLLNFVFSALLKTVINCSLYGRLTRAYSLLICPSLSVAQTWSYFPINLRIKFLAKTL